MAESLYQKYSLKRVFYSAFVAVNKDKALPAVYTKPPLLREHRLYQADWLLRFYGFKASELLSESRPDFDLQLDPKCNWAIRHLEYFPVEINTAGYYQLLRVPGTHSLDFTDLQKIGVVLKRALYFITCNGRMMYRTKLEEDYIIRNITDVRKPEQLLYNTCRQLSFFDREEDGIERRYAL